MDISRSPAQKRCRERTNRALPPHRLAQPEVDRWFLLQAMVSNIDLLPRVVGESLPRQPIWHWSNEAEPDWFEWNEESLNAPTELQRAWISGIWDSEAGVRLKEVRAPDARGEVLAEWQALLHEALGDRPGST
jgi:hypothetical protein